VEPAVAVANKRRGDGYGGDLVHPRRSPCSLLQQDPDQVLSLVTVSVMTPKQAKMLLVQTPMLLWLLLLLLLVTVDELGRASFISHLPNNSSEP